VYDFRAEWRCAILTNMGPIEELRADERWHDRLAHWSGLLRRLRLEGVVGALLEAGEPLSPFGAHLLWIAQPALSFLVPREDVAALAQLLEEPGGLARVRRRLVGPDDDERE
jgi:hypothetical protein